MTTVIEIVRAAIPGVSERVADHILWGRTPYPMRGVSARELYKAASRWRRACDNGLYLCDFCDRLAVDDALCESCSNALKRVGGNHVPE